MRRRGTVYIPVRSSAWMRPTGPLEAALHHKVWWTYWRARRALHLL